MSEHHQHEHKHDTLSKGEADYDSSASSFPEDNSLVHKSESITGDSKDKHEVSISVCEKVNHGDSDDNNNNSNSKADCTASNSRIKTFARRLSHRFWIDMVTSLCRQYLLLIHVAIWLVFTGYFIAALAIKNRTQLSDILPLIAIYVFLTLRILFWHWPVSHITKVIGYMWSSFVVRPAYVVPRSLRVLVLYATPVVAFFIISLTLSPNEYGNRLTRLQSFLGMIIIFGLLAFTSRHPTRIPWHTVAVGQTLQLILGAVVLRTSWGYSFFRWISFSIKDLLLFSKKGCEFMASAEACQTSFFFVTVFPPLIFFAALIQMAYYAGVLQWVVGKASWLFTRLLDTSGSESIVAVASPFVGMSENALLVRSYINGMTDSELHAIMTAGFSTTSGSTMMAYISYGIEPEHIITACIMSIPCSLAISKIRLPETEVSETKGKVVPIKNEHNEQNLLHAAANGAANGMQIVILITATIIAVISLLEFVNFILTWLGQFLTIKQLTIQLILGYVLYPFTWMLGVSSPDLLAVAKILATKIVSNEINAYRDLMQGGVIDQISPRSGLIVKFALCGFANIGSIGIQVGSVGAIAPARKGDLARLAFSAMMCGFVSTCMSALIIGMLK